jgi:hypothetical protein
MLALAELQARFGRALLGSDSRIASVAIAEDGLGPDQRLQVYANNCLTILSGALAAIFPATQQLLGERFFVQAARAFVRKAPPSEGPLFRYGGGFPDYLSLLPDMAPFPFVPDVARFEWVMNEAYHAADCAPLAAAALQALPLERYEGLQLRLHPSARLIGSQYPVHAIWEAARPGAAETPVDLAAGPVNLLVIRPEFDVIYRVLGKGEAALVGAIADGATLADAGARALDAEPALALDKVLAAHLSGGSFASFS